MGSNYDKMKEQARQLFLEYDQEEMIEKFHLEHSKDAIWITFAGEPYEIRRADGAVVHRKPKDLSGEPASFEVSLSIYDMLCHSKGYRPVLAGEWTSIHSLYGVKGSRGHVGLLDKYAAGFDHRTDRLLEACARMGGKETRLKEDAGCVIPVFPFFPVYLQFWESDEDFPAKLQFLLDKNASDFIYYETMWYIIMYICERIEKEL